MDRVADRALPRVSYHAVAFGLEPPKRGGEWPDEWPAVAGETVAEIVDRVSVVSFR